MTEYARSQIALISGESGETVQEGTKQMSSVRGCDDCGVVFFETAEGWGNGTVNKMVRNPRTDKVEPKQISVDYCPTCVEARETGVRSPMPSPSETVVDRRAIAASKPGNNVD